MTEYIYGTDDHEGHWLTGERIVRCRDCIYYQPDPNPIDPGWPMWCEDTGRDLVQPNNYCAWGEPRKAPDPTCDECGMKCIEKYRVDCPKAEREGGGR